MKTENSLYIKILLWIYKRKEEGFTENQLKEELGLNDEEMNWYVKLFKEGNSVVFLGKTNSNDENILTITSKGISDTIGYLRLKEVEESGKRAECIALWAIGIGVIVGVLQLMVGVLQLIHQ